MIINGSSKSLGSWNRWTVPASNPEALSKVPSRSTSATLRQHGLTTNLDEPNWSNQNESLSTPRDPNANMKQGTGAGQCSIAFGELRVFAPEAVTIFLFSIPSRSTCDSRNANNLPQKWSAGWPSDKMFFNNNVTCALSLIHMCQVGVKNPYRAGHH